MSGKERLPEDVEGWMSVSLRGRRSEEIIQSNTSSPWESGILFESQRG